MIGTTMRRGALAICLVGCLALPAAAQSGDEPGFIPPREPIAKPYTNDKCLTNCHGVKGLAGSDALGRPVDLSIDLMGYVTSVHGKKGLQCIECHQGADPNVHPREGYPKVDCRACHSHSGDLDDIFPFGAREKLLERNVAPPPNEALKAEVWAKTKHAKAYERGNPDAPFCSDCHTAHYVLPKDDPNSTVHATNLPETCGKCHDAQAGAEEVGGAMARWRIAGHGKGDLSSKYRADQCLSCHQGEGAHGEDDVIAQACPSCHRPGAAIAEGNKYFHLRTDGEELTASAVLSKLYNAGLLLAALGLVVGVLVYGFLSLARTDDEK